MSNQAQIWNRQIKRKEWFSSLHTLIKILFHKLIKIYFFPIFLSISLALNKIERLKLFWFSLQPTLLSFVAIVSVRKRGQNELILFDRKYFNFLRERQEHKIPLYHKNKNPLNMESSRAHTPKNSKELNFYATFKCFRCDWFCSRLYLELDLSQCQHRKFISKSKVDLTKSTTLVYGWAEIDGAAGTAFPTMGIETTCTHRKWACHGWNGMQSCESRMP